MSTVSVAVTITITTKIGGFFRGPCATFPTNFVKIGSAGFCVILLTNKKASESVTSLAEVIIYSYIPKTFISSVGYTINNVKQLVSCI